MRSISRRLRHGRGFLQCRALTVEDPTISTMYSTKKDSMTIQVQVHAWHKKTETSALLDSGATHNFIDTQAVKNLGLGTRILTHPHIVHNMDRTINQAGTITQYCNLWIRQGERRSKLGFFIASLGHDRIILRHPWFKAHNPTID